ncbi:putative sodium/potassium/calcium exchanger [Metaplanococcus flavidus]|uniref:Uncharacterized protein n=1 Tax=Metaplanococcus flavidus TaxID=569883 RepID=A0ABW3LB51_9BACL
MDNRKIANFIRKANRRLKLQFMSKTLQIALGLGLASALIVTLFSRLSIFPYYGFYAYSAAGLIIAIVIGMRISKMPRREQAIFELDQYTPHNQLLTLLQTPVENSLAADLAKRTEKDIHFSYRLFKQEKNDWFSAKWLLVSLGLAILLLISSLFPASSQLAAKDHEQEQELIQEMIEEVEKIKEQGDSSVVRNELESLEEKLAESETAEQALRELVKKQKELALKQQEKEKEDKDNAAEEADTLEHASSQLAEQAGKTQTALSEMGKSVAFDLQESIAANDLSGENPESSQAEPKNGNGQNELAEEGQQEDASSGQSDSSQGEGGSAEDGSEQASGEEAGEGSSDESNDAQEGQGNSESASGGESAASGEGNGKGSGQGSGQGSRELLSIPSRIGGTGETAVDDGELSEGETESFEEGPVDAERGIVRPYREVVGSYSDSYFSSAERMRLPPDLQKIVEQYFSAIE